MRGGLPLAQESGGHSGRGANGQRRRSASIRGEWGFRGRADPQPRQGAASPGRPRLAPPPGGARKGLLPPPAPTWALLAPARRPLPGTKEGGQLRPGPERRPRRPTGASPVGRLGGASSSSSHVRSEQPGARPCARAGPSAETCAGRGRRAARAEGQSAPRSPGPEQRRRSVGRVGWRAPAGGRWTKAEPRPGAGLSPSEEERAAATRDARQARSAPVSWPQVEARVQKWSPPLRWWAHRPTDAHGGDGRALRTLARLPPGRTGPRSLPEPKYV